VEIAVQICGKVRGRIEIAADADEDAMREAALSDPKIAQAIAGKTIRKIIVVRGRIVNIVAV
jgi:leucyl-tRNA synthetase